jgi:hypothetical protein
VIIFLGKYAKFQFFFEAFFTEKNIFCWLIFWLIRTKEFKYFNPKNCFQALGNMIRVVSSRIRILIFHPSRIPDPGGQKGTGSRIQGSKRHRIPDTGVKKAPDPGSATQIFFKRRDSGSTWRSRWLGPPPPRDPRRGRSAPA